MPLGLGGLGWPQLYLNRCWLLSGEPGSPPHGVSSWLAQAHSHLVLGVLGAGKSRQVPMCLPTVPWPRASSDLGGGQIDSTSGWEELQRHIAKGHTLGSKRIFLCPSLRIVTQKATNHQDKNARGEGHPLESCLSLLSGQVLGKIVALTTDPIY